jgi:hypothetical protein
MPRSNNPMARTSALLRKIAADRKRAKDGTFALELPGRAGPAHVVDMPSKLAQVDRRPLADFGPDGNITVLHQHLKAGMRRKDVAEATRIAELDAVIDQVDAIRLEVSSATRTPWPVFAREMRLSSAQAWGKRAEKYLAAQFGWTQISPSEDRGDVVDRQGRYYEQKVTMITATNSLANFVQIRPWQDLEGYQLFVVEPDFRLRHLYLTKDQMATELKQRGQNAHGVAARSDANTNREYAIRITWNPAKEGIARDWVEKYSAPLPAYNHPLREHMISQFETAKASRPTFQ